MYHISAAQNIREVVYSESSVSFRAKWFPFFICSRFASPRIFLAPVRRVRLQNSISNDSKL